MALIHEKIIEVLKDAGAVAKSERNAEQKFNYRGIDAVVNAINPLLKKHEIAVLPTNVKRLDVERFENANKKIVTEVVSIVEYTWIASDGSTFTTEVQGEGRDFADKAVAKAASVAFRTLLLQSFALPTDDTDPDAEAIEIDAAPKPVAAQAPATGTRLAELQATMKDYLKAAEVADPATGEMKRLTSAEMSAVAQRISGKKDASWKADEAVLAKVVAAIEAGERE